MRAWPWHARLRMPAEICALGSSVQSAVLPTGRLPTSTNAVLKPAGFCLRGGSGNALPMRSNSSHAVDHTVSGSTAGLFATLCLLSCRVAAVRPHLCAAAAPRPKGHGSCWAAPL